MDGLVYLYSDHSFFIAIILSSFILAMYDKVVPASVLGILGIIGVFGAAISLIMGRGDH